MFETDFTIKLAGFSSKSQPLTYAIYGITSYSPLDSIMLSASPQPLSGGGVTLNRKLPFLVGLQAVVTDKWGEIAFASTNCTVQNDGSDPDWLSVAENIKKTQNTKEEASQKWQYYAFVANQANNDAAEGKTTEEDAHDTNLFIATEARDDADALSATDADA